MLLSIPDFQETANENEDTKVNIGNGFGENAKKQSILFIYIVKK